MRRAARPSYPTLLVAGVGVALALSLTGCGDDARRPVGASCVAAAQCETNICGGGACLEPAGDLDGDGLINAIEAALGTDPANPDTDGDGVDDLEEVGDPASPNDADEDGKIDAIESVVLDCDEDGLVDQEDPDDGTDARGICLLNCPARAEALSLIVNTTTADELEPGLFHVYAVETMPEDALTIRLGPNDAESFPELRVFYTPLALCEHATVADKQGLARADELAPPTYVGSIGPGFSLQTDVVATGSTLYLRVDNGAVDQLLRYSVSAAP